MTMSEVAWRCSLRHARKHVSSPRPATRTLVRARSMRVLGPRDDHGRADLCRPNPAEPRCPGSSGKGDLSTNRLGRADRRRTASCRGRRSVPRERAAEQPLPVRKVVAAACMSGDAGVLDRGPGALRQWAADSAVGDRGRDARRGDVGWATVCCSFGPVFRTPVHGGMTAGAAIRQGWPLCCYVWMMAQ
jgi:hypothetical protein